MNNTQSCLSKEDLDRIGHDEILPDELRAIEDHVSQCERCRSLFTATTFESDWTETILPALRDRHRDLPDVDDESNWGDANRWIGNEAALSLLGPTDDPRMVGRIGPYEVTGIIGRGGMGIVFKAFDAALNRFVAIKMLLPHLASSGSARKRFSREGQAAAAVIDDHVLPIFGVDEWQGVPYIVSQYSSGTSLQKRIHEQGPLELKEILRISLQVARGLAAAHAQGLVHRDVKPSNILLDRTVERALLTDFGLARAVDDATITRSGTIAGTPQFMAPEQARGEAVDGRSDLFSLGSVMYAMCTGHPPFRANSSYGVMRRITDEEPRPIREINGESPEWLSGIVRRLMAKRPQDRFESASEVAELLEQCLAHVQQPASVPLPAQVAWHETKQGQSSRFSRKAKVVSLAVIGGLLLAVALAKQSDNAGSDSDPEDVVAQSIHAPSEATAANSPDGQPVVANQIGTVLGKPVTTADLNENVELREDLVRLFVRPVEEKYLKEQQLDPEDAVKQRIPDDAARAATLMFVRQRVLHKHLYEQRGGRVLLTAFGPIAYDAHRQWLEEREEAGDFQLNRAEHRELLFAPLDQELTWRLTEDLETIQSAFDPASTEDFIQRMSEMPAQAAGQETDGKSPRAATVTINQQLAQLPASIHQNFATDALPLDRFDVQGQDANKRVVAAADGIQVSHPGQPGYSSTSIETRLQVHGNFEVTVSFEDFHFAPCDDGSGAISLTAILDNDAHTHCSVQRGARNDALNPTWHFVQSEFVHSPARDPGVVWLGTGPEAATSGRLRLARVGDKLHCLFAAGDSPEFRLIHTETVGTEDLLFGGVRLNTGVQSNGSEHGTASVIWKDLTIRAERITDWPGEDDAVPEASSYDRGQSALKAP